MPAWGRGGAGNIMAEQQLREENKKAGEDIEANKPLAASGAPPPQSQPPADYAHMGRGGAGNWYEPKELEKEGNFSQPADSTALPSTSKPQISTPWHPENQEMPVARAGRGGAGNFVWSDGEKERRRLEDEERAKEKVNEKVEAEVEQGLPKPPGAVLGGVKAGRGW